MQRVKMRFWTLLATLLAIATVSRPCAQGGTDGDLYDRVLDKLFPRPASSETFYCLRYAFGLAEAQVTFTDIDGVAYRVDLRRVRRGAPAIWKQLDRIDPRQSLESVVATLSRSIDHSVTNVSRSGPEAVILERGLNLHLSARPSDVIVLDGARYTFLVHSPGRDVRIDEWGQVTETEQTDELVKWMLSVRAMLDRTSTGK
jgi:hypothetical protein